MNISILDLVIILSIALYVLGNKVLKRMSKKARAYVDVYTTGLLFVLSLRLSIDGMLLGKGPAWGAAVAHFCVFVFLGLFGWGLIYAMQIPSWRNPRETDTQVGGRQDQVGPANPRGSTSR